MSNPIDRYKRFIDDLVALRPCVSSQWILEGRRWAEINNDPQDKAINTLVETLNEEQKQTFAMMLDHAYDAGIHDTLSYLDDASTEGLRICQEGDALPIEPFDTPMHYDFICRCEDDQWPDETI